MQILRGSKREITLMQWNEQLKKAKKKLEESKKCYDYSKTKIVNNGLRKTKRKLLK